MNVKLTREERTKLVTLLPKHRVEYVEYLIADRMCSVYNELMNDEQEISISTNGAHQETFKFVRSETIYKTISGKNVKGN